MARKYLADSLDNLFDEIDARWPKRDRRTDGWYTNSRETYGHNRRERGLVHAIDVDRDGIDPMFVVNNIAKGGGILWYVIWNRTLYSNTYGWKPRKYTGPNPHTDHLHIEIYHTVTAETYRGSWNIASSYSGFGPAPSGGTGIGQALQSAYRSAMNEGGRDYRHHLDSAGNAFRESSKSARSRAYGMRDLRR